MHLCSSVPDIPNESREPILWRNVVSQKKRIPSSITLYNSFWCVLSISNCRPITPTGKKICERWILGDLEGRGCHIFELPSLNFLLETKQTSVSITTIQTKFRPDTSLIKAYLYMNLLDLTLSSFLSQIWLHLIEQSSRYLHNLTPASASIYHIFFKKISPFLPVQHAGATYEWHKCSCKICIPYVCITCIS